MVRFDYVDLVGAGPAITLVGRMPWWEELEPTCCWNLWRSDNVVKQTFQLSFCRDSCAQWCNDVGRFEGLGSLSGAFRPCLNVAVFDEVTGLPKNDPTWYRPGMPEYVASTHLVSPCNLIDFMRFRCGSHSLAIATGRWHNCPREERICQKCTANEVEDEYHVMFRCSAYEYLRVAMHTQCKLFDCVGGIHRAKRAGDAGMSKFMNQSPRHVARYVSECMQLRETNPDLRRHFEDYHVDLFSSDGDAG